MGRPLGEVITLECRAEGPKVTLPEGFCAMARDQLAAAYPNERIAPPDGKAAPDAILRVLALGGKRATVQLDWRSGAEGPAISSLRAGASLDAEALSALVEQAIRASPRP